MHVSDVWRNIGSEIGVYWKGQFDNVPPRPGVYSWFYPLRVSSLKLDDLVRELQLVFDFDATTRGVPIRNQDIQFTWETLQIQVGKQRRMPALASLDPVWDDIARDERRLFAFRQCLMRASILMPPLYVGKTTNLRERCWQHIHGSGMNDFHSRYCHYADAVRLNARSVKDLIFTSILTEEVNTPSSDGSEVLLEEILKFVSQPAYGLR